MILVAVIFITLTSSADQFGSHNTFDEPTILPVDEAFALTVVREKDQVTLLWQIQPGHYLYRHRIMVTGPDHLGKPNIPVGIERNDEYFGDVEVYYEALQVDVPIVNIEALKDLAIIVEYQGCADRGICYPPQKRHYTL
ncbi:MAG: thiol:disulfide interchange protein DsbD [Candidatus Azotimanducaceae bacterium]|jgi:thiol:disulfide interchange protein DsbD